MMEIKDAIELYQQYLLVEKGLSKQTVISYTTDYLFHILFYHQLSF